MGTALSKQTSTAPIDEKSNRVEPVDPTLESLSSSLKNLSVGAVPLSSDGSLSVGNLEEWEKEISQVREFAV